MRTELTKEEFLDLMKDFDSNSDGTTNKKCPICGNDVIEVTVGTSGIIRCKTEGCFSESYRGI